MSTFLALSWNSSLHFFSSALIASLIAAVSALAAPAGASAFCQPESDRVSAAAPASTMDV